MAVNLTRKTVVAVKNETAVGYGVSADPDLTDATETQLVYGDGAGVWQADTTMVDLPSLTATMSPEKQIPGRSLANVSLQACVQQPSTAGNPVPYFDALLQSCGMSKSTDEDTSCVYTPSSDFTEVAASADVRSCTVAAWQDGIKTQANGVYSNADFNFTAGQAPTIQFAGQGLYVAPSSVTASGTVYPTDNKVLVESETLRIADADATGTKLIPICRSITLATGNSIVERGDVNASEGLKGLQIISRAPTLNLVIEAENELRGGFVADKATAAFFANLKSGTRHYVNFVHTQAAGYTATFNFPTAQLTSVNMSDDGGIRVFNLSYLLTRNAAAGDDEYSISFANPGE